MMMPWIYFALAVLLLLGVMALLRVRHRELEASDAGSNEALQGLWDPDGLALAERIFSPADYFWLKNEVGFPGLARSLRRTRQRMALEWLRLIRCSFNELLKTPDLPAAAEEEAARFAGWVVARHAVRFYLVLGFAYLVVRCFGPYHRLVPTFGWLRPLQIGKVAKPSYGPVHSSRLS